MDNDKGQNREEKEKEDQVIVIDPTPTLLVYESGYSYVYGWMDKSILSFYMQCSSQEFFYDTFCSLPLIVLPPPLLPLLHYCRWYTSPSWRIHPCM